MILQPCSTPGEIRDALELVPDSAQRMHGEGVSPVSMHAYRWIGRQITCLTTEEDDGTMSVHPGEALEQFMGLVAGRLTRPMTSLGAQPSGTNTMSSAQEMGATRRASRGGPSARRARAAAGPCP